MAKLRSEGETFDPLQGAPITQVTGDAPAFPADAPAPSPPPGEFGGIEDQFALVEHVPAAVLVADAALELVFVNKAAREAFAGLEAELHAACGVGPDRLLGQSLRIFHKEPDKIESALRDLGDAQYETAMHLGDTVFRTSIRRAAAADGGLPDYIVCLRDDSALDRFQGEMARIRNMVDNAPTNLMMADTDLNITYVNPAMRRALETIRDHLPVPPDDIVGASLDLFYTVLSDQRAMLSDPDNLPHEANFEIGPESVRLQVDAIYDHEGRFIGPMATWEFVTEKLRLEAERKAAVEREMDQAESLRRGVDAILAAVQAAVEGDLDAKIEVDDTEGAIGQVGGALRRFFEELRQQIRVISRTSRDMASASDALMASSQQMGASAEQTSSQANTVSGSARAVSDGLQTIAAAIEEMSSSIGEISTNTTRAAQMAQEAVSVTETTNDIIAKLGERSSEIGNVTKQITSIAEQTNLLALNATIEAARAGEAGKGFAVVANEVKELARETGEATEDIGTKIEAIQAEIENAVEGISKVSGIIRQINDIQVIVASAVEQQTATSGEMSQNIGHAAQGGLDISNHIEGVADAARNAAAGAQDTQTAAKGLGRMSVDLQELVSHFRLGEEAGGEGESVEQLIEALEGAGYAREDILKVLEETAAR